MFQCAEREAVQFAYKSATAERYDFSRDDDFSLAMGAQRSKRLSLYHPTVRASPNSVLGSAVIHLTSDFEPHNTRIVRT
jgi:hypothetical protein